MLLLVNFNTNRKVWFATLHHLLRSSWMPVLNIAGLVSSSHCQYKMRSERRLLQMWKKVPQSQVFHFKSIFKSAQVVMDGLFFKKHLVVKIFCNVHRNVSTRGKKLCFNLGETWCGRSVSPTFCDCTDPSHQFLRPHHTTITTNHNMPKKFPSRNNTPVAPTKRLPKTAWPHLPTRKEGLITRRTTRRPGVRHQNVLKPHQVGT